MGQSLNKFPPAYPGACCCVCLRPDVTRSPIFRLKNGYLKIDVCDQCQFDRPKFALVARCKRCSGGDHCITREGYHEIYYEHEYNFPPDTKISSITYYKQY